MRVVAGEQPAADRAGRVAEALQRMRSVVGDKHVVAEWERLEPRARDTLPRVQRPAALVAPASAEEVSAVVRLARETGVGLWPISQGRNWAYGAATPALDGTIVLTLERLNRIVEVNADLAYAVVEAGVTFGQLHEHLTRCRIPLCIDPTDGTPHGSIIGNALDRGIGTTPYGDHFGNLCGIEVVLADGRIVHSNGRPDSQVLHTYKWGTGPNLDGLLGQSGIGIVTRAGVWLMPAPEAFRFYLLEVARDEQVAEVLDAMRRLVLEARVRTRLHLINDAARVALVTRCPFGPEATRTCLTPAELAALRRQHGVPPWLLGGGIYGTRAQVREQERELRRAVGAYGRLRFMDERQMLRVRRLARGLERLRRLPGLDRPVSRLARGMLGKSLEMLEALPHAFERARGLPTEHFLRFAYYKAPQATPEVDVDPARDGGGLIWFAPSLPLSGQHLTVLLDLCRPLFDEYGFDFTAALMPHNDRAAALVMGIHYYKESAAEAARAEALYELLREVTSAAGYPQYRVSAPHQGAALAGAPTFWALAEQLKRALDPDGVIAPGRYGLGAPV